MASGLEFAVFGFACFSLGFALATFIAVRYK